MLVTAHVAVISYVVRTFTRPTGLPGSVLVWVPVTIVVAVFLSWPFGHAIARAFEPAENSAERTCPRCGYPGLRPLLRAGGGLFRPVVGHRCVSCKTTYRPVDGRQVEQPSATDAGPDGAAGIVFLPEVDSRAGDDPGVRFLDDEPTACVNFGP